MNKDGPTAVRPPEETPTVVVTDALRDTEHFAPGRILGGRYRIVSRIGSGGMGSVYRGDDLKLGQPVAMKFLRKTSESRERLLYDEVRIGRQVSHPNICRLHDIVEVDGQIFITMELVDGEDLSSLLRRIGRLPHDKAASVGRDLCAGLAAAHEMGVIHRDLKPGNVMIDGRGRARITDFGLAVAADARGQASAGTPAYMAPEQLAGGMATPQSDIYALGLVLYELFTGRRVYNARSFSDIVEQQRGQAIPRPAEIVRDIDPAVERAILHCLEPDPEQRPHSVQDLMRELPSFDPLAAALAAGETPSPAMVAAASERGDLRAAPAWSLLAIALVSIAAVLLLSGRTQAINNLGEIKAPAVMLERVHELLEAAGIEAPARDVAWYFFPRIPGGGGAPVIFVYRQSPRPMVSGRPDRMVSASEPSHDVSGMAMVRLAPSGRLLELAIVPPQRETAPPRSAVSWDLFLDRAGIDRAGLVPAVPEWAAPLDTDEKHAWLVRGTSTRAEAASYHGRPVWFAVLDPATRPGRMVEVKNPLPERIALGTMLFMLLTLPVLTILIGVRNLRRGQGDRRGAGRVATAIFVMLLASMLLRAHHLPALGAEWVLVSRLISEVTFWSLAFWMAYIAVEPLVRRRWPNMLISWSRLVEGRWRDPMVGRDLLIGIAAGAGVAALAHVTFLLGDERMGTNISPIGSIRHTTSLLLLNASVQSIGRALFGAVLLLALRAVLRRMVLVAPVAVAMGALAVANLPGGPMAVRIAWAVLASWLVWTMLLRIGLMPIASASFAALVLTTMPLTSDPSSWYFGTSILTVAPVAAIALFGFWTSLGGKSPVPRLAFD